MKLPQRNGRWAPIAVAAAAVAAVITAPASAQAASVTLPPVGAKWDYQIGQAYTPPAGVKIVSRDWKAAPAAGLYNICYINAFQTQKQGEVPDGIQDWPSDLKIKGSNGKDAIDPEWKEAILDITTDAKRQRIATRIKSHIDDCASKGFNALELDNYDSFTRGVVKGKITKAHAEAYVRILSSYGHSKGLAVAQKNTAELASRHAANGLDFAVVEDCGRWTECGDFVDAFGNNIVVVEYTDGGLATACEYGDRISVVRRDENVTAPGSGEYRYGTC
ncbi:endo alpha-1,4 polygalactosaminidase [Streptomyces sp. NPDC058417]|uniref:endo alpha-1,4 polygalactosaminidase n=1 Tax=unclassified Streptomyces TaxID=2593676 RepID=UPI0036534B8F